MNDEKGVINISCGIYKIINKINNKIYIGKSINIELRFRQHKYNNANMPIDRAIRKYGKENFTFEIIEECDLEELNDKEKYWIQYYDTCYGSGYNCTPGGDGASHPVKLTHDDINNIISLLQESKLSIKEIADLFSVSSKTIHSINNGKSRIKDNISYPIRNYIYNNKCIIPKDELLQQLQKTKGNFDLIGEQYSVTGNTIRNLCKEYHIPYHRSDYGFVQTYYNSERISQFDMNDNFIAYYDSIREAGRQNNINPKAIYKALYSKSHCSHNYKWYLCN